MKINQDKILVVADIFMKVIIPIVLVVYALMFIDALIMAVAQPFITK